MKQYVFLYLFKKWLMKSYFFILKIILLQGAI